MEKFLTILASPRKGGNSEALVDEFASLRRSKITTKGMIKKMEKILAVICSLSLIFSLVACSSEVNGGTISSSDIVMQEMQENDVSIESSTKTQIYIQTNDGHTITFQLNESSASKAFYEQLPLDIWVEDYAGSEKTFYPPEKLDIVNAPMAKGPVGTLAYYEPWGNVAIFYKECDGANGLYELGEAVAGVELLADLSGEIEITILPKVNESQTSDTQLSADTKTSIGSSSISSVLETTTPSIVQTVVTNDKTAGNTTTIPTLKPTTTLPPVSEATPEPEAETDNSMYQIQIVIGNQNFPAVLYKNETTDALIDRLPMTLDMNDMNGNEKYYYFSDSLSTDLKRPLEIHAGDLMLYGTDCLVLFYESFSSSYSYTTLGYVEDSVGLASALGSGNVQVSFNVE